MKRVYKTLNSVETSLLIWDNPFDTNGKDVILCVTGNPGVTDFYIEFAAELYQSHSMPICVIGQAGHEEVPHEKSNILSSQEHLFNLEGQIKHKLDLINNCIDKKSKLHLIGHSIGAWLIIEILQKNSSLIHRVSSVNLLFPTLQRMAISPNGKYINNTLRKMFSYVLFILKLIRILPICIKKFLIDLYLLVKSLPPHYYERIYKVISPSVMEKVMFLAFDEMDTVVELNKAGIIKIKHLTNVIYSDCDNWAPLSYMEDLKVYQPELQLHEVKVEHAFVLKSSVDIAQMVAEYIQTKSQ
ncbi:lipid droplet-associated hydrolase [Colias croceus]|uniref:lipid droplet-associated hydrolase n=1 Tax=Colias crocea TaxID=72248 RepID=UPI001E27C5CB|nr:lipid droplet-associated hydrolase [Colias croceus]XP_045493869.1 lipid droplet-associated hydrolase [Colias croceus]